MYDLDLQERVETYMITKGVSQAKLAPMMGVGQTALSQWRNSKYDKGNIKELELKIKEFFKIKDEVAMISENTLSYKNTTDYIPTSISEDVYKLIKYCHLERGMVVVHGDAGIGKTKACEKYAKENPASTIYIQATPSSGTLSNILKLLARALKMSDSGSKLDLMFDIRDKLDQMHKVIIIDEAQHLKLAALEEIRTLSDPNLITGQKGTGIVLVGNKEVYNKMLGKQEARFAQLFSRIKMNRSYNTRQVTEMDIKLLFPSLISEKKEVEFLHNLSKGKWGIRGAVNVYNNAVNNNDISYNALIGMAKNMGIVALS